MSAHVSVCPVRVLPFNDFKLVELPSKVLTASDEALDTPTVSIATVEFKGGHLFGA